MIHWGRTTHPFGRPSHRGTVCILVLLMSLFMVSQGRCGDPQNGTVTRRVIVPEGSVATPIPTPRRSSGSASQQRTRIIMQGELMNWVNQMLERIVPHLDRAVVDGGKSRDGKSKGIKYRIRILDDPSVNAMTLADGRMYLTKGLLKFVKNDDELASVIAHECGHVEMRHHSKRALKQTIWQGLAMLGAAMSKAEGEGFLGATLLGSLATMSYSRNQEHEADKMGTIYCQAAGYNPTASVDFIERLVELETSKKKENAYEVSPIFRTHPPSTARALKISKQIEGTGPYPPKVLTYNPARLFYAPMEWSGSQSVPAIHPQTSPVEEPRLHFNENFEGDVAIVSVRDPVDTVFAGAPVLPGHLQGKRTWYLFGNGAAKIVTDKVGIGRKTLKVWSSGKGQAVSIISMPVAGVPAADSMAEFLITGNGSLLSKACVYLHCSDGTTRMIELTASIEGEHEDWRLLRITDFSKVVRVIDELRADTITVHAFSFGWSIDKGSRCSVWIDELRLGSTTPVRVLDSSDVKQGSVLSGIDEDFNSWTFLRGSGVVQKNTLPDTVTVRRSYYTISPPEGEQYASFVSPPIDASRLKGGYMIFFYARATEDVRIFAGLEHGDEQGEKKWEPAGGTDLNSSWKRLRLISDERPAYNTNCRIRFDFSSNTKDFEVSIDEVILVSLLKP